jgi:hypothetical protein
MKTEKSTNLNSDSPFSRNGTQDTYETQETQGNSEKHIDSSAQNENSEILSLPLTDYLKMILEHSEQFREEDIESWHSPVFFFARFSKAHPAITNLPSDKAMLAVEKIMRTWKDLPRNIDPWEFFITDEDADEAKLDFMASWDATRHLPFHTPLQEALRLAEQTPLQPQIERGNLYAKLVSVAAHLQLLFPDRPILLPCRAVAALLGCAPITVSRCLRFAIKDGLLVVVKYAPPFKEGEKRKATEFRFAVERLRRG